MICFWSICVYISNVRFLLKKICQIIMQVMLETFNNIKCLLLVDRVPVENSFTPLSSKNEYTMDMRITRLRPA